jgi:hypothetical protein
MKEKILKIFGKFNLIKNERKQVNRDVEQSGSSRSEHTTNNSRDEQSQRFIYWDDESD